MSYVTQNLIGDEKVIFLTKKHPVIFFFPAICTFLSLLATKFMFGNDILQAFIWLPWLTTLILWLYCALEYWTAEFGVTTQRILMREGFFYRHVSDLRLNSISQMNVIQDPVGQLFNYGTISINAFGAYDDFAYINRAADFRNAVNEQLYKLTLMKHLV